MEGRVVEKERKGGRESKTKEKRKRERGREKERKREVGWECSHCGVVSGRLRQENPDLKTVSLHILRPRNQETASE